MKQLTLAAAQIICCDGNVQSNLEHASLLAQQAHERGAQLLLFPEFMPQGYRLTLELWDSAEPFDGPTTHWLRESARTLGLYIGTSFLEAKDGHFFNTFALADPSGKLVGAVYKRNPSMWEAYFFKGKRGAQYIDTDLGCIGVGICFDNHTYEVASAIAASNVDLMLMPHSYCTPTQPNQMTSLEDIERLNNLPGHVARMYNEWFGVPVMMCNKSGAWDSPVPDTTLGIPKDFRFSGRSIILDADQTVRGKLGDEEVVLIGTVTLDTSKKKQSCPSKYSRYIYPGPPGREIIRLMEWQGSLRYTFNKLRQKKAVGLTWKE
jgi:N-carbamoylputrescine amidase